MWTRCFFCMSNVSSAILRISEPEYPIDDIPHQGANHAVHRPLEIPLCRICRTHPDFTGQNCISGTLNIGARYNCMFCTIVVQPTWIFGYSDIRVLGLFEYLDYLGTWIFGQREYPSIRTSMELPTESRWKFRVSELPSGISNRLLQRQCQDAGEQHAHHGNGEYRQIRAGHDDHHGTDDHAQQRAEGVRQTERGE